MASTSTSSSPVIRLTDRDDDNRLLDLATREASRSIGSLDISLFGPVYESHGYNIRLLSREPIESEIIGLSVNGDDVSSAALIRSIPRDNEGYEYQYVLNLIKDGEPQRGKEYLFSLTYGFARIELVIPGVGSFLTLDVPCVCSDEISTTSVQRMLERLLDTSDDTVASWMYAGGRNDPGRYAIIEGGFTRGTSKSLLSFIQLVQGILDAYESWLSYFRTNAHCTVIKDTKRVSGFNVRTMGVDEFSWLMKNSDVLSQTKADTGFTHQDKNYFPRFVDTEIRTRSYDNYENRVVVSFLDTVITALRLTETKIQEGLSNVQDYISRLEAVRGDNQLPALVVVEECARRERAYDSRLTDLRMRAQRLLFCYGEALPGVELVRGISDSPRRTKVFQEMRAYSAIYQQIEAWHRFGDFSLVRESLALHALRLDKLYEYYALFRLLEVIRDYGFSIDESIPDPICQTDYSLDGETHLFSNEKNVNTLYQLKGNGVRLRLYYQPVIYGDSREQYGITLHRKSPRSPFLGRSQDTFYTPDYLIEVETESGLKRFFMDAKYSRAQTLMSPQRGNKDWNRFRGVYFKYLSDIIDTNLRPGDALWLLAGRESRSGLLKYETASWISGMSKFIPSGICPASPNADCLDELLRLLLSIPSNGDALPTTNEGDSPTVVTKTDLEIQNVNETKLVLVNDDEENDSSKGEINTQASVGKVDNPITVSTSTESVQDKQRIRNPRFNDDILRLITQVVAAEDDWHDLLKAKWAQNNLKLNHPLLRSKKPSGSELRNYVRQELSIGEFYAYANWLPQHIGMLKRCVARRQKGR